jgi:hypothetical protein
MTPTRSLATVAPLIALLAACGGGPAPVAPPSDPAPATPSATPSAAPTTSAAPSLEDPAVLPDRKGLAQDHPLFEGLRAAARCDLTLPWDKRDECAGVKQLKKSLPGARAVGDASAAFDVSLIRVLSSSDASLRMAALVALGGLGGLDYRTDPPLASALLDRVDQERDVRTVGLWADVLGEIRATKASAFDRMKKIVVSHPLVELRIKLIKGWAFHDEIAQPIAKELAKHEDPDLRRAGLTAMWTRADKDASVCPAWIAAAKDKDPQVEFTALDLVFRHCDQKAWGPALAHLEAAVKAQRTVFGVSGLLTWAKTSAKDEPTKKRLEAIEKGQKGESWAGDLPERSKR